MTDVLNELKTLTVEDLSEATGIPKWRIRELLKQGKAPPHFRVGRIFRFPVPGVRKWLMDLTEQEKES